MSKCCGSCEWSKRDWTNSFNPDYYCSCEDSEAYGCNTMYTDSCSEYTEEEKH